MAPGARLRLALACAWRDGVVILLGLRDAAAADDASAWITLDDLRALRDEHETNLRQGRGTNLELAAWMLLNQPLGDHDRIAAWGERNMRRPEAWAFFNHFDLNVFDSLVAAGAWRLAGQTLVMPASDAFVETMFHNHMDDDLRDDDGELDEFEIRFRIDRESRTRIKLANLYTACLAAERWHDADLILQATRDLREDAPFFKLALVMTAADAGVSRDEHTAWLDEIEAAGVTLPDNLRQRVEANLRTLPR